MENIISIIFAMMEMFIIHDFRSNTQSLHRHFINRSEVVILPLLIHRTSRRPSTRIADTRRTLCGGGKLMIVVPVLLYAPFLGYK